MTSSGRCTSTTSRRPRKFPHAAHFVVRCSETRARAPRVANDPSSRSCVTLAAARGVAPARSSPTARWRRFCTSLDTRCTARYRRRNTNIAKPGRGAGGSRGGALAPLRVLRVDPDALRILSRERTTGEPMPSAMIDALRRGKRNVRRDGSSTTNAFALADLDAHSIAASDVEPRHVSAAFADAARSAGFRPNRARRGNLIRTSRGVRESTHYSYVYAGGAAAEAWRRWFVGDALAPGAGEAARDGLLKHGGAGRAGHTPQKRAGGGWTQERSQRGNRAESNAAPRSWACGDWSGERRTRESIRGPSSVGDGARTSERSSERNSRRKRSGGTLCVVTRRFSPRSTRAPDRLVARRTRSSLTVCVDSPSSIPRRRFDACDSRLTRARAPVCSPRRDTSHRLFRWPTRRSLPVRGDAPATGRCLRPLARARTSPRRF